MKGRNRTFLRGNGPHIEEKTEKHPRASTDAALPLSEPIYLQNDSVRSVGKTFPLFFDEETKAQSG